MFANLSRPNQTLHLFSGEDRSIINALNHPKINRNFNIIGFFVILICIGCLLSAASFIFNVMDGVDKAWSIPIGLFWGFAVTIIYILLLYTITPVLLIDRSMIKKRNPSKLSKKVDFKIFESQIKILSNWLSTSMVLRLFFIALFAVIVAQPLNVFLFKSYISTDIEAYKQSYKTNMVVLVNHSKIEDELNLYKDFEAKTKLISINKKDSLELIEKSFRVNEKILQDQGFLNEVNFLNEQLLKLNKKVDKKSTLLKKELLSRLPNLTQNQIDNDHDFLEKNESLELSNQKLNQLLEDYNAKVTAVIEDKDKANNHISSTLDNNSFYIRQIIFVNEKLAITLFMNILFVVLFIFPIYLKFQVRKIKVEKEGGFYQYKEQLEKDFVLRNYKRFKRNFEVKFEEHYASFYSRAFSNLTPALSDLEKVKPDAAIKIKNEVAKRYSTNITFYEKYLDPPFNLKDKQKHIVELSEDQFINTCDSE